ncbi:MAG: NAD(P)/FAD-dependent oxidoreductase [Myxococcota bacterium]
MNEQPFQSEYDVVIVGARVAGAATALRLAHGGLRVLVFDKGRYGADTLSTHALMRPAVQLLDRWGVLPAVEEAGTPPVRKTTFWYSDGDETEVASIDIKPRHGVDALYAPRRTVLDRALVDAARGAGADVRFGVRLDEVIRDDFGRVSGVVVRDRNGVRAIRASLVIGADGRHSRTAALVGAAKYVSGKYATATAYGYFRDLPVDGYRWYFRPGMGSGALPTNADETLVFASVSRDASSSPSAVRAAFVESVVASAPDVGAALEGATLSGRMWFFPGMPGFLRQPWGSGWALVGDAGYMSDPITAHGITNALRDAELLSRVVLEGRPLGAYQLARDHYSEAFFEVSDRMASYEWDIPTVQQYHRIMSREMNREETMIANAVPRLGSMPRGSLDMSAA